MFIEGDSDQNNTKDFIPQFHYIHFPALSRHNFLMANCLEIYLMKYIFSIIYFPVSTDTFKTRTRLMCHTPIHPDICWKCNFFLFGLMKNFADCYRLGKSSQSSGARGTGKDPRKALHCRFMDTGSERYYHPGLSFRSVESEGWSFLCTACVLQNIAVLCLNFRNDKKR